MRMSSANFSPQSEEGEKRVLNSVLWHACAGPLVSLPAVGSHVVYFPQGHSEQVAATTNKEVDAHIPNYPSLPPQLICQLHDLIMHADVESEEVFAQMTLQPLSPQEQKEAYVPAEFGTPSKQPTNYFCKTLTASDTSTHGGFSVPRRAAEKVFPPLDFSQQPPAQELIARDLHENEWKFRHIFRGQPKRHLLTTGWSVFVSAKRLVAGDSVLFIWNEKNQLLIGIRRASRPQTVMPSSVLSSDSMHLGLLAAAAHAATTNSRFTIFYNPRASPSEFVIPLARYIKAIFHTRVSVGMRFRMLFETEDSSVRRYMGTITGISDLDPVRWSTSHWRSVKVGWDESTTGERQPRVSLWEVEPLTTFPMYPSPFNVGFKRPWPPGMKDNDLAMRSPLMWFRGNGDQEMQSMNFQGFGMSPWMQPRLDPSMLGLPNEMYQAMAAAALQEIRAVDPTKLQFQHSPQNLSAKNSALFQSQPQQSQSQQVMFQNVRESELSLSQPEIQIQSQNQNLVTSSNVSPLQSLLGSFPQDDSTHLFDLPRTDPSLASHTWPSKRPAMQPHVSSGPPSCNFPSNACRNSVTLPPFPGVNIEPLSFLMQNGLANLHGGENNNDFTSIPFTSDYMNNRGHEFSLNTSTTMMPSSCVVESGLLQSLHNVDQENSPSKSFVKVHKLGSLGRSLDITKFSNYRELRNELAHMFGLQGQLEDPLRSGWQLVFVDRENDVLLLGDDPWQEFVNSVWCIKILSPQEVQQMGEQGLELLNSSAPIQRLSNGAVCDDYVGRQDSRNLNAGVSSLGSVNY